MTSHVVMFSGGITSWAAAKRVAERHGTESMTLLFADTLAEDEDLHRFLAEAAADIGVPVTRVCDGRTPHEVDVDRRWLSNSKVAQCSLLLKIEPSRRWLEANTDPASTVVYVGTDWSELHRLPAIAAGWKPWPVEAPLCDPPYVDKRGWIDAARAVGIEPPRLYALGFEHNNCGGACVRGGHAQWAHLLGAFPDRFAAAEAHEQRMRDLLGADVAILKDRSGGVTRPLPLSVLRRRVEGRDEGFFDPYDWGGCGCMTDGVAS